MKITTEDNTVLEKKEALEYIIEYNLKDVQYSLINLENAIRQIERRTKELKELKNGQNI